MGLKESGLRGSLRNVSVGIDAIPDEPDLQWLIDEGSETTITDENEDLEANFESSPTWRDGDIFDNYLEMQANEDGWLSDPTPFTSSQWTLMVALELNDSTDDGSIINAIGTEDLPTNVNDDGNVFCIIENDGDIGGGITESGSANNAPEVPVSVPQNEILFVAVTANLDTSDVETFVFDKSGDLVGSNQGNSDRDSPELSNPIVFSGYDESDEFFDTINRDEHYVAVATDLFSQSQISDIWDNIRP